ncbi:hypothetical protein [Streptomyces sp. CoH27]|uniref:hypothetical protein n=1 Tax=Streptomyces sp. CoH27 TaxID=2875763 RepID=UPI001CD34996|nr:hypothetical protein [Streptomyces sp. CoH27]
MHATTQPSRRALLKAAGTASAATVTGTTALGATALTTTPAAAASGYAHPGLLHTRTDLDGMAAKVRAGASLFLRRRDRIRRGAR